MNPSSRRPLIAAALVVVAIGVFEVFKASFMADDFTQLGILEGVSPLAAAGLRGPSRVQFRFNL